MAPVANNNMIDNTITRIEKIIIISKSNPKPNIFFRIYKNEYTMMPNAIILCILKSKVLYGLPSLLKINSNNTTITNHLLLEKSFVSYPYLPPYFIISVILISG